MEAIKFSVELNVNVNLTQETKNFITDLAATVAHTCCGGCTPKLVGSVPVDVAFSVDLDPTQVKQTPTKPESTKDVNTLQISIEDVRNLLAAKVNEHRAEIKMKLTELGAPSVTKLDPNCYEEMYNFLQSL